MDGLRVLDALSRTLDDGAPLVTPPLCVATRYRASSCRRCLDVCPSAAIQVSPWLRVDDGLCARCGACAAVCRTGALDAAPQRASLRRLFAEAAAQNGAALVACVRTTLSDADEEPRAVVPCLGGLAVGDVVAARRLGVESLTLARGECAGCAPEIAAAQAGVRARVVSAALTAAGADLHLSETDRPSQGKEHEPVPAAMSRRGLFATLAGGVGSALGEPGEGAPLNIAELHAQYGPSQAHKALLSDFAELFARNPALCTALASWLPLASVAVGGACDGCGLCARYCPHAAIAIRQLRPVIDESLCTACGLCAEVCLPGVLALEAPAAPSARPSEARPAQSR